jgi:predicted nucleic acid-binding protein
MKRLFVDINIVIDLLSRREPFFEEAAELFSLADKKQVELSAHNKYYSEQSARLPFSSTTTS